MKLFPDNFVQNVDKAINAIDGFLKKYQELGKTSTNLDNAKADLDKYQTSLKEAETKLKSFGNITTTIQAWKEQKRQVESYEQSLDVVIKKSAEVNASKKTPKTTNNEDYNNLTKLIQLQNEYNRVVDEGKQLRGTAGAKTNAVKNAVSKYLETENISIQKLQRSYAGLRSAETSYIQQMATTDTNSEKWEKLKTSLDGVRAKMLANKLAMNQLKKEAVSQELTQSFGLTKFTDTSFSKAAQQFISSARAQLQQLRAEGQNLDILNPQDLAEFDKLIQKIDEATTRAHDFEDALQKKNEASSMVDEKTKEVEKLQKAFDNFDSKGKIDKLFSDLEKLGISTDGIEKSAEGVQQLKEHLLGVNSDGVKKLNDEFGKTKTQIQASENAINKIRNSLGDLGQATTSLQQMNSEFEQLKSQAQYFFGLTNSFNLLKRAIRGAYETVKKLDAAMTETAVVTDFSVGDMWEQLPQYTTMAKKLGATTEGAYRTAALYYQQGLDTAEAMQLSTETMKMARVAGMEYATATKAMTSALRGFNMELSDMSAQRVNDVYSELAKITATDTQQLATAMTKTASIAYSANMEFENVSAFLAQILETTQEAPETAGTALKTIIGRFTEVKKLYSSNQLIGKDSEGEEIQVNKVSQALSAAGINLNEFFTGAKGLDDILYELSQRWDTLDVTIQRYIATQAAGSRQQSRFIALMQNNARLTELMNAAKNSKGSAEGQFEKTLDSLEAKVNKLRDAWEEFLMGIANSDLIKGSIDLLTKLLEVINKLTKGTGGLDSALMKLAVVGTALQLGGGLLQGGLGYFNARRYAVQAKGMAKAGVDKDTIKAVSNGFTGDENIGSFTSYLRGSFANFGNLGFVGMIKDMFKGIQGLFKNTLSKKLTKELQSEINKEAIKRVFSNELIPVSSRLSQVRETTADMSQYTKLTGGFKNLWSGLQLGNAQRQGLGDITSAKNALNELQTASGGAASRMAKFGTILGSMGPSLAIVAGTLGALALAAHLVYINSDEYKLKKIQEQIEGLNDALDNTNKSIDELKDWKDNQNSAVNKLKELTRGTTEFNQALVEANQNVLTLLQQYDGLKLTTERGEFGELQIDEKSLEDLINAQTKTASAITSALIDKTLQEQLIKAQDESRIASSKYFTTHQGTAYGSSSVTTQGQTVKFDKYYENYQKANNGQSFADYIVDQLPEIKNTTSLMSAAINYEQAILKEIQLQETADQKRNEELVKDLNAQSFFEGEEIEKETAKDIQLDIANNYFSEGGVLEETDWEKALNSKFGSDRRGISATASGLKFSNTSEAAWKAINKKLFGNEDLSQFTNSDGTLDQEALKATATAEIERLWQKQQLGEIMTVAGKAGSDSLITHLAMGSLTQDDLNQLAAMNGDYSSLTALRTASNLTEGEFTAQINQITEEAQAAIDASTARFTKYFGEDKAKEFGDLDSAAAIIMSNFANQVKVAAGDKDFQEVWDSLLPNDIDMKDKVKIAKALSAADRSSISSIKAQTKALVQSGVVTQDVADKIANSYIYLNNAVKQIDFSAVFENLQTSNKFIRDIKENQQRSFSDKEYESLKTILGADGTDRSNWFTQTLEGEWVYLGSSIETLTQAIYENTSALLGQSQDQLKAKDLLQDEISKDKGFVGWINQGASTETYTEKVGFLEMMAEQAKNNKWNELLQKAGINLIQDWGTLDITNANGRQYVDDMYSQLSKLLVTDYSAQIAQIIAQDVSYKVQSQNPWSSKSQAAEYLAAGDQANSTAYYQGMVALANSTEGVNMDIITKAQKAWEALGGSIETASAEKVKAYGQAMGEAFDEIARAQDRAHLDKLKSQIDELDEGLSKSNYAAKAAEIAKTLSAYLGIKVDGNFVQQYKDLIETITEEGKAGTKALEELREKAIALSGLSIDPIEIDTILNTDNAIDAALNLANYLGQLVDQDYTLLVSGQSDMSDILGALSTIIMRLALLKSTATTDSDQAVSIMTNAADIINQIADAMGFEMDTEYSEKPLFADFSNYRQEISGEPGNQTVSWVKDGTSTSLQVGSQIAMSFKRKDDSSPYNFVGPITNSSPEIMAEQEKWSNRTTVPGGYKIPPKTQAEITEHNNTNRKAALTDAFNRLKNLGLVSDVPTITTGGRGTTDHMNEKDKDKSSGSGSGSKDSPSSNDEDKWENSYDWLYNLTQDINAELEKREKLELKYNNILKDRNKTAKELYQNAKAQLDSLEKSRNLNAEAYANRVAELKLEAKQATAQYTNDTRFNMKWGTGLASGKGGSSGLHVINLAGSGGGGSEDTKKDQGKRTMLSEAELGRYATFNWDDNTVEINWDAVNQITDQQKGEAVEDYISKLEEIQEKMNEAEKSLLEIDGKIREIIDQGKDEFQDFEQQIFDALVSRYQKEIDKLTEISEAITDANSKLIDSMTNAIDKEREARDNEKTETELADKQKQLDYLRSDTSNANAKQILDLEKELAEGQEDYTDQLIDQKIDELKEQNDKASEQRQVQIDLMTKNLEMAQETGALWQEVYNLMDVGVDQEGALVKQSELFDLLQSEAGWQGMSAVSKMTWLDELTETVKAGMAYLMTGRQLEYIGAEAGKQITFSAYDEQGKLQWLTGTVDKNGDVVDSNGVRYSEIFQNYDGSFTTMETAGVGTKKEPPKPEVKPSAPSSSGGTNTTSSNSSGTVWKIGGNNGVILNSDGPNSGVSVWDPGMGVSNAEVRALRDVSGDLSRYNDNEDGFLDKKELGAVWKDNPDINPKDSKYLKDYDKIWDPYYKKYPSTKYATGGLNTQTGPAWLDGTFAKPELVLNSKDTANFLELRDLLRALQISIKSPHRDLTDNNKNNGDNYYEIDINVESIADDYDVAKMADKIKKLISQDALYRNGNAINRLR